MADFDFSTIIYLVIMIVFAVLGGRRKKKPVATPSTDDSSGKQKSENPLDILGKFFNDQPQVVYETQNYDSDEEEFMESEFVEHHQEHSDVRTSKNIVEINKLRSVKPSVYENIIQDEINSEPVVFDKEDFDLKKAVIYSEIMNRKIY
jgi:hypothetical protein